MDTVNIASTKRLKICRLSEHDGAFILQLVNEPSFIKYIGDKGVRDLADAMSYLNRGPIASYRQHGFGLYKILRADDNVPVGICGLIKRDILQCPDLGFAFLSAYTNKGYAFEAATAILHHELRRVSHPVIAAITAPQNDGSITLLKRLGFELITGHSRPSCGEFEPANYFELSADISVVTPS